MPISGLIDGIHRMGRYEPHQRAEQEDERKRDTLSSSALHMGVGNDSGWGSTGRFGHPAGHFPERLVDTAWFHWAPRDLVDQYRILSAGAHMLGEFRGCQEPNTVVCAVKLLARFRREKPARAHHERPKWRIPLHHLIVCQLPQRHKFAIPVNRLGIVVRRFSRRGLIRAIDCYPCFPGRYFAISSGWANLITRASAGRKNEKEDTK